MNPNPNLYLETIYRDKISSVNKVFRRSEFDSIGYLPIHLNIDVGYYKFVSIYSLNPMNFRLFTEEYNMCLCRAWIDVPVTSLDLSTGYHLYTVQLVNIHTNDIANLYFSYTIQNDEPEKPYLYLKPSS
jgi:hypothetical protein